MTLRSVQESPYIDANAIGITPENAEQVVEYLRLKYRNRVDDAIRMIRTAKDFAATRSSRGMASSYTPSENNAMDIARFLLNMNEKRNLMDAVESLKIVQQDTASASEEGERATPPMYENPHRTVWWHRLLGRRTSAS